MALIKCSECGKEMSDHAKMCPNCGYELKKDNITLKIIIISIVITLLTIFFVWLFINGGKKVINNVNENKIDKIVDKTKSDYYGTYTLTKDNFKELNGKNAGFITINENNIALQEINITKDNLIDIGQAWEKIDKDFSFFREEDEKYYLAIKLKTLISDIDKISGEMIICMKKENNKLLQTTCMLEDNTTVPIVNIEYTKK